MVINHLRVFGMIFQVVINGVELYFHNHPIYESSTSPIDGKESSKYPQPDDDRPAFEVWESMSPELLCALDVYEKRTELQRVMMKMMDRKPFRIFYVEKMWIF